MAKKKGQSKPKHPKPAPPSWQKRFRTPWKIVAFNFSFLLAGLGYYYQYGPQILVTRSGSLNPTDPFATEFIVKNESLLAVPKIRADCRLNNIELAPPLTPPMKLEGMAGMSTGNMPKLLSRGESMAITCFFDGFRFRDRKLKGGELLIEVSFRYLLRRTLNSACRSINGFLLFPEKDRMRVVLAGFPLTRVLSWIERGQTIRTI